MDISISTTELQKQVTGLKQIAVDARDKTMLKAIRKVGSLATKQTKHQLKTEYFESESQAVKMKSRKTPSGVEMTIKPTADNYYKRKGLIKFSAKETSDGVTAHVQAKKITKIKDAFIATMPNGHRGVFVRTKKRSNKGRYKIKEIMTIGQGQMFNSEKVRGKVEKDLNKNSTSDVVNLMNADITKQLKKIGAI